MGLREILADPLNPNPTWDDAARWLREHYLENEREKVRINAALKRERCYQGTAQADMREMIDTVFKHPDVRRLRREWVEATSFVNVVRRIVNEKATVYNEPARRAAGDDQQTLRVVELGYMLRLDEVMREVNRRMVLDEDVLVNYRVRDDGVPTLDVIGPGHFWAIAHPDDPSRLVGVVIETIPHGRGNNKDLAHYQAEIDGERFRIDGNRKVIIESVAPSPFEAPQWMIVSATPPSARGGVLASNPSEDLVSAHFASWFLNVLMLKEAKSATKQVIYTGDTSRTPTGQMSDTEADVLMGEGVTVSVVDRSMEIGLFREVSDYVLERTGANHGLPPSVLHHRDSSSGAEIHLRRIPLRELRRQQIMVMRQAERRLAEIMAMVNAVDLPAYGFDSSMFTIDFGEIEQPMTEQERLQIFELERRMGLSDTATEIMRRDHDVMSKSEAMDRVAQHVEIEAKRVELMQKLAAMNGGVYAEPAPTFRDVVTDEVPRLGADNDPTTPQ